MKLPLLPTVRFLNIFILAGLTACSSFAQSNPDFFLVADFNRGNQNFLGGFLNKYERDNSKAAINFDGSVFRGDQGKSLQIIANKGSDGFCGAWMHLFDFRDKDKQYFDASSYNYLSFWVKGKSGGEKFTVKIADKRLIEIEDSTSIGKIDDLLPNGVTREWQEVVVPLKNVMSIDKNLLGGITFDFPWPGNYTVYIDDIAFKKSKDVHIPENHSSNSVKAIDGKNSVVPGRTMWVWTVYELLKNENNERDRLFETCERENVTRLWLQLPTQYEPPVDLSADPRMIQPARFKISLAHENKLRKFIRQAHNKGIAIEGLDGYPEYAQKPYHFIPLAIVDAVIDYNNRVEPEERFDGIHFDNEPYLIIGWHNKERREQILYEFLELNVECQRRIHAHSDMVYGVDVPFWWNADDPATDGAIGDVTFNGERKPAVFFCIDLLDNIGIMNYRDTAYGVDGIIAHAEPILKYAEEAGKDKIYVGLEVFRYEPTTVWFPLGMPREAFYEAIKDKARRFGYLSRINGFRTQLIDDGKNIHVGIELPKNPDKSTQQKINDTVVEMSRYLGAETQGGLSQRELKKITMYAQREINKNPEWENYAPGNIKDPETSLLYPGFKASSIMLGKTTFADESYDEFKKQVRAAESELINYPAYVGTAIHYFKVLDEKFREAPSNSAEKISPQ